jgi:lysophospholipase L1-like esterase
MCLYFFGGGKMNRFIGKINFWMIIILFLSILMPLRVLAEDKDIQYVALGNSLAAGYLNDGTRGDGYPVYIKNGIEANGYTVHLDNLGVGGFTTVDVLNQLTNPTILEKIANADILTIDIGANDVLRAVDLENLVLEDALVALNQVKTNLGNILEIIREQNPTLKIYVMGYYNALPFIDNQTLIKTAIDLLNNNIASEAGKVEATFIPTYHVFEGKYDVYLPNPDIHPTKEGYKAIANEFLTFILNDLPAKEGIWYTGNGIPSEQLGNIGDYYLDLDTYIMYQKTENGWIEVNSLKGANGQDGTDGKDGTDGQDGQDGKNGKDGKAGKTWYVGKGKPNDEMGNNHDYYFDTETVNTYVKSDSGWMYDNNIKGPKGDKGDFGGKKSNITMDEMSHQSNKLDQMESEEQKKEDSLTSKIYANENAAPANTIKSLQNIEMFPLAMTSLYSLLVALGITIRYLNKDQSLKY